VATVGWVHIAIALTLPLASLMLYLAMMALFALDLVSRRARGSQRGRECAERMGSAPPRVTIFKPLAGCDEDLEANLESFARVDYPSFEILFGVADVSDPALPLARRFMAEHPQLDSRIVVTDPLVTTNPKVAQLVGLERVARGDVYVISDSNVRVSRQYLWSLVRELANEKVGMVTSLFAGTGERTLGAALENLQLCAASVPGLVALNAVTRRRPLTVGKSMAMRRRDLARLGGFLSVGEVLAEDYELGRRFLEGGFELRSSLDLVENRNVGCSVARTLERHTRWSKLRRSLFPAGFAAEPLITPIVAASIGVAIAPGNKTAAMLAFACVLQTSCALFAVRWLRGYWLPWRYIPLEIMRSYVSFFCWLRACGSRRIEWRGHAFLLKRGSAIVPIATSPDRSAGRARLAA
jgi:ceramide glucosyltransferase